MNDQAYKKYQNLIRHVDSDPEYLALDEMCREAEPRFRAVLRTLPPDQQAFITDYFGLAQEMALRALELACFLP